MRDDRREHPLSGGPATPGSAVAVSRSRGAQRLLLLSQLPPPYGGLAVHTERLRSLFEREGWRVDVLTPPGAWSIPPGPLRRLRALGAQVRFLARLLCRRCTVLHDHVSTYPLGDRGLRAVLPHAAMLLALRLGASPWVVSCGNGRLPSRLADMPPRLRQIYRWLYRGATFAIAKNERILEAFQALGFGGRVQVIGTFLEPLRAGASRPLPPEVEAYFAAHPLCVLTAGFRFEPVYHLDAVVRAVAHLRREGPSRGLPERAGLVVLASRVEEPVGKAAFDAALAETGLAEDVLVLRDVDHALEVMSRASVCVRATDYDGDANTVKEAMLLGVPVLATDVPGRPPGITRIGVGELGELGSRLVELLLTFDTSRREAARAYVLGDIERNADAIRAVYQRAMGA